MRALSALAALCGALAWTPTAPSARVARARVSRLDAGARLPLPLFDVERVGLAGLFEDLDGAGTMLLRPPADVPPRAVLHFLGGAFVGAAPHITYRYLLEALAREGFLVVSTPYRLEFDYLELTDKVLARFERAARPLAQQYGALPVIGVGHSCGALLHVLITCLFPDTPRAANALISFNNKPAGEAIPMFEEAVVPLATELAGDAQTARWLRETSASARSILESAADGYVNSTLAPRFAGAEILPLLRQSAELADQVPPLFEAIADGVREFTPTPADTRETCRRMYRARRTLLIQFENDALDETAELDALLKEAQSIMRMKRPLVDMAVDTKTMTGTHITPLTQDVFLTTPLDPLDPLSPTRQALRLNFLRTIDETASVLVDWLKSSTPPSSAPSSTGYTPP